MRHIQPGQMPLLINELSKLCEKTSVEEAIQPDAIKKVLDKLTHPHTHKTTTVSGSTPQHKTSNLARKRRHNASSWKSNSSISQKAA